MRQGYGKTEGVETQRKFGYQQLVAMHFLLTTGNPIGWEMFEDFIEIDELSPGSPVHLYQVKSRKSQWTPAAFIRKREDGPLLNFYITYKEAKKRFGGENFEMILITNNGLNSQLSNLFEDLELLRGINTLSDILRQCSNKTKKCIEMIRNEIFENTGEDLDNETLGHFLSKLSIHPFVLKEDLIRDIVQILEKANSRYTYKDIMTIQGQFQEIGQKKITLGDIREWIGIDISNIPETKERFDVKTYLQKMIDSTESINSLYVPLKGIIRESKIDHIPLTLPIEKEVERKEARIDLIGIFRREDRLILIGDSGSGKTTVLQHFVHQLAKDAFENPNKCLIPVFIELNKYRGGDFIRIISKEFLNQGFSVDATFMKNMLHKGHYFIILDGLNEIKGEFREEAIQEIRNLTQIYQKTRILLSSRELSCAHELSLKEVYMEKLSSNDIIEFMETYFKKLEKPRYQAKYLYYEMSPEVKEIVRNPLMLAMMIKLIVSTTSRPKNLSELFQVFVDGTLEEWERKIGLIDPFLKKYALSVAAYIMNSLESTTIEKDQLMVAWGTELSNLEGFPKQNVLEVYKELLISGIIKKSGPFIQFSHQSFQDYFGALYLKRNKLELEHVSTEWWRNCIIFLAGITDHLDILVIKALNDVGIFFACELLASGRSADKKTKNRLRNELKKIIINNRRSIYMRSNAIEILGRIGTQEDISFLEDILNDKTESEEVRVSTVHAMYTCEAKFPIEKIERILLDLEENSHMRGTCARLVSTNEDFAIDLLKKIDCIDEVWEDIFQYLIHGNSHKSLEVILEFIRNEKTEKNLRISSLGVMSEFAREVYREEYEERFSDHHEVVSTIFNIVGDVEEDVHIRVMAIFAIPLSNKEYRENLYKLLMDRNTNPKLRRAITSRFCNEVFFSYVNNDFLLELLSNKEEDIYIRKIIAENAHESFHKHLILFEKLTEARFRIIDDSSEPLELRVGAAIGLGWDGQYREVHGLKKNEKIDQTLLRLFRESNEIEFKRSLIESLVRRKVNEVIEILEETVRNRNEDLEWRLECCVFLSWIGDEESIGKLFDISKDPNIDDLVRKEAISVLGPHNSFAEDLKDSEMREKIKSFLIEFLGNVNISRILREEAIESLSEYIKDMDKIMEIEKQCFVE